MLQYNLSNLDYLKLIKKSRKLDHQSCTRKIRIALLADCAPQYLSALLETLFCENRIEAEIFEAEFDTIETEVFNPESRLYQFNPDYIFILQSAGALRRRYYGTEDKASFAEDELRRTTQIWEAIQGRSKAIIIQSNYVTPYDRIFGNLETKIGQSLPSYVQQINFQIAERVRSKNGVFLCDMDALASYVGKKQWADEKMWVTSKAFCAFEFLPLAAQQYVDITLSFLGAGVKCIVLDLDNTLWGGIIGDDGLEGISLGHFQEGEAFEIFQHFLLELKKRGILLAVCSKNDPDKALLPFRKHPDMILKEEDITVFIANWNSKAENIKQIREILNIGYDSMVFLDDSAFERKLVREMLPQVIVPELPEDPANYVKYLCELNLFETTVYSKTDSERADLYRLEAKRKLSEKTFENPEDYLKSLEMKITLERFDAFHLPRIVQLMQRSNQFNLMTQRFTQADCEAFAAEKTKYYPFYIKLKDKYGDHGLISVAVLRLEDSVIWIDEWLMSCRVLARGVEQFAMNHVFEFAVKNGYKNIAGNYRPTEKNAMVKEFYKQFGFEKMNGTESGETIWSLRVESYRPKETFIQVEREASLAA